MIAALVVACIVLVVGIILVLIYNIPGVIISGLLTGAAGAFLWSGLKGFGSPTGHVPKFDPIETFLLFILISIVGIFFYFGLFFIKAYFSGIQYPKYFLIVWGAVLAVSVTGYAAKNFYLQKTARSYRIEVGSDPELPVRYDDFSAFLINDSNRRFISINGSGVGEKNKFGYSRHISGKGETHFEANKLELNFFKKHQVVVNLPAGIYEVTCYLNKDRQLKIFFRDELVETRQIP